MRVLLLNGGGIDSLAVAMILSASGHETHSLHVDFGYPSSAPEKVAAELIASTYCANHLNVSVSGLDAMGFDEAIEPRYRPVQYQQLLLTTIGASHAQMNSIPYVVTGVRGNAIVGPNFRELFGEIVGQVNLKYLKPISLVHPLETVTTTDALFSIIQNSPILHDTVSCLALPACGTCIKCKFRAKYGI